MRPAFLALNIQKFISPADVKNFRFQLHPAPPFRLDLTVWVLRRRPSNRIDSFDGRTYQRVLLLEGDRVLVRVEQPGTPEDPELFVNLTCENPSPQHESLARVALTRLLGLDANLQGFYELAAENSELVALARRFKGVRPPRFPTLFESLANGIIFQQISLEAAISILNKFAQTYGMPVEDAGSIHYVLPEPELISYSDVEDVKKVGLTANKARALIVTARAISEGSLSLHALEEMDNESAYATLVQLRGIGKWTADYVLLRGLGRLNVFPRKDVGALKNLTLWLKSTRKLTDDDVEALFAKWRDYSGFVYFHLLLRGLAEKGVIE